MSLRYLIRCSCSRLVGNRHRDDLDHLGPCLMEVLDQRGQQFAEAAFAGERDQLVEVGDLALKRNEN
jgi:hypothetical protein